MEEVDAELMHAAMSRATLISEIAIGWSMAVTVVGSLLAVVRAFAG